MDEILWGTDSNDFWQAVRVGNQDDLDGESLTSFQGGARGKALQTFDENLECAESCNMKKVNDGTVDQYDYGLTVVLPVNVRSSSPCFRALYMLQYRCPDSSIKVDMFSAVASLAIMPAQAGDSLKTAVLHLRKSGITAKNVHAQTGVSGSVFSTPSSSRLGTWISWLTT